MSVLQLALLSMAWAGVPATASPAPIQRTAFHIPSQPLQQALLVFSQQAGMQLVAVGELGDGRRSVAVDGAMRPEDALRQLLGKHRFVFAIRAGMVTVSPAAPPPPAPAGGAPVAAAPVAPSQAHAVELASTVVTARRRDERWMDVPMALSVLTGERMATLGLENVTAAIQLTPGAGAIDAGGSFTQVQIRGVSNSLGGNDNGYYLDSIPFTGVTVPWHPDTRAFDLDRVEVLKGPQGTLFGEGSMGGTIRILTRAPELDRFAARIETGVSGMDAGGTGHAAKAMVNMPLQRDALALRVVATQERLPGWVATAGGAGAVNAQQIATQRGRLRWSDEDARWTSDLTWMGSQSDADGGGYAADDTLQRSAGQSTRARWRGAGWNNTLALPHSQLQGGLTDARLDYYLGGKLSPDAEVGGRIHIEVATRELRWGSQDGADVAWVTGVMQRRAYRQDDLIVNDGVAGSAQTNRAHAAFGEVTVPLLDPHWSVTAGARYFVDRLEGRATSGLYQSSLRARFRNVSPRLAITRQATPGQLVYASASSGFRSGQLQPLDSMMAARDAGMVLPEAIKPDSIVTYEVGAKRLHAQGRVLLQGAVFHSRWRALPVRIPIDAVFNGLVNSRGAAIDGVELGVAYAPRPSTSIEFGGSYIDASYVADVPGTPLLKGAQVYNVPRLTLTLAATHAWPIHHDLRGVLAATGSYHSRRKTSLVEGMPGDDIFSARVRLGLESSRGWSWYLYGENLTDESGAVDGRNQYGQATRLRPRTYGLEFHYAY